MASTMKNKVADAGHAVADAVKKAGNKVAEEAKRAGEFVKEKTGMGGSTERANMGLAGIKEHMNVVASCGTTVGVVDRVEGNVIKLTKNDSPDGQHHYIPGDWVERVDDEVHLKMNSEAAEECWKSDAASCA